MLRRGLLALSIALAAAAPPAFAAGLVPDWVEQGPGPIFHGDEVGLKDDPVAGAVNAIIADEREANSLMLGTVNGGIWVTSNADVAEPTWVPRSDEVLPALSIASLARSPANPKLFFGGTGSTSSYANLGSRGFGVLRSVDSGATWQVVAKSAFVGQVIDSIVPTTLRDGAVVLAATRRFPSVPESDRNGPLAAGTPAPRQRGLFFSENATAADPNAVTFHRLSGEPGIGLPEGGVSSLIADPSNPHRFYVGISATDGAGTLAGVYRTDAAGVLWGRVDGTGADALTGVENSSRILLAIHSDSKVNALYAAVIARGALTGVFRSVDLGAHWTSLGFPEPAIFPGLQGDLHGALVADPTDPNVAFISGDRQDVPFPNANGCRGYFVSAFRVDAGQPAAKRWQNAVCDGANGTAPHADSRAMAFDANGDLLLAGDGGIYRLTSPNVPARRWVSVIGTIRPTEFHSVAYDPFSKVIIGGTQDNGTAVQSTPGSFAWNELRKGDGGVVAVDADQTSHPGTSLRYSSYQFFAGFLRTTWNAANTLVRAELVKLKVTSGNCKGRKLTDCDSTVQFYTPFVLGSSNPSRMLIGTNALYESLDRGERLDDLTGNTGTPITGLVYGGRISGDLFPGVIYAGDGAVILHRINRRGALMTLKYPGSAVRGLAADPLDYRKIVVLDDLNRIWLSDNEGMSWTDVTGNLGMLTAQVRSIAFISRDTTLANSLIIAGGFGIFQLRSPGSGLPWAALATADGRQRRGLPNALVLDLHYDAAHAQLLAGTLGRGAWTLSRLFAGPIREVAVARNVSVVAPAAYDLRLPPPPPPVAAPFENSQP